MKWVKGCKNFQFCCCYLMRISLRTSKGGAEMTDAHKTMLNLNLNSHDDVL